MHTGRLFAPSGEIAIIEDGARPRRTTSIPDELSRPRKSAQDYTYQFVVKCSRASPGVFAYRLVPQLRTLAVHVAERLGIWRMLSVATLRHQDAEPAWLG